MYRDESDRLTVQWFARARFEQPPDGRITLGRIGAELREKLEVA